MPPTLARKARAVLSFVRGVGDRLLGRRKASPGDENDAGKRQSLTRALDRAIELGLLEHADRLAASAIRLRPVTPPILERIARLRLIQGRFETALAILDGCSVHSASMRLLRIVCLLLLGRHAEAQLDLQIWSRKGSVPLGARCLLALLEMQQNDHDSATETLMRNVRQMEDPLTFALLTLNAVSQSRIECARRWAKCFNDASQWTTTPLERSLFLRSLGLDRAILAATPPREGQADSLKMELIASEQAIPILVSAQEIEHDPSAAMMIKSAIAKALPELSDRGGAYEALARLARLGGDVEEARHWIALAREAKPMSATIARVARELGGDARSDEETQVHKRGRAA